MFASLFIGGWGDVKKQLVGNARQHACPVCHEVSRRDICQIDKRATVYFMPVFTYSSRKVVVCAHCGNGAEVSDLDIASLRAQGQAAVPGEAAQRPAAPAAPASHPGAHAPGSPVRSGPARHRSRLAKWVRTLQGILVKTRYVVQDAR